MSAGQAAVQAAGQAGGQAAGQAAGQAEGQTAGQAAGQDEGEGPQDPHPAIHRQKERKRQWDQHVFYVFVYVGFFVC